MYYIATKQHLDASIKSIASAHFIDLPNGKIFAKVVFGHVQAQNRFERQLGVVTLPHPSSAEPVGPDVAKQLSLIHVAESHRTYEVAKLAATIHPMMKLR